MPEILENADEKLSTRMRRLLDFLWQEWKGLQEQIESLNTDLEQIASSDPSCVRLQPTAFEAAQPIKPPALRRVVSD